MQRISALVKQDQQSILHLTIRVPQPRSDRIERYPGRFFQRIAVSARADSREADGARAVSFRQVKTGVVTGRQFPGFAVHSIAIDGPNGVKHMPRWKRPGAGYNRAASGTSPRTDANSIQLAHDGRSARAMDSAIHAASASETRIRRIDDGIDANLRDIADHQAELLPMREIDLHIFEYYSQRYSES